MTTLVARSYPLTVGRRRTAWHAAVLWALSACAACTSPADAPRLVPREPRLPAGEAGQVLQRAIDAAGGWQRWREVRDVGYVNMLTIVDPVRGVTSDSIGWFTAPLHGGVRARMDSLGLPTEVRFGIDAEETWIVSDGAPITAPGQLALTRFDMLSSLFWFSLPFALAEAPVTLTYLGEERGDTGQRWLRLKAEFDESESAAPGPWFVLYLDADSGLIDRVHGRLTAPFLRHDLWVGQWLHYRDCDGIKKERQRKFFPADDNGAVVGAMVAEQFIEHVHFNNGYGPGYFLKPPVVDGTKPVDGGEAPAGGGRLGSLRRAAALSIVPGPAQPLSVSIFDRTALRPFGELRAQGERKNTFGSPPQPFGLSLSKPCSREHRQSP